MDGGAAETTETIPFEQPVIWLVEYQREHCSGATALTTFQGLLTDEIYLPQSAAEHPDPEQLVLALDALADAMLKQVHFIPGEFSQEVMWSFYARDYLATAKASGHEAYYAARGGNEIAIKCAGAGLKSMLAAPHLDLFNAMVRLKRSKPADARKFAAKQGYSSIAAAFRGLDKELAELEAKEPLTPRHKTWLKSLRKLKLVPDAEMTPVLVRLAKANPLFEQRRAEAARVQAEREATDPAYQAARRLCEMAELKFSGIAIVGETPMREVWAEGPDKRAYMWRVRTDRGERNTLFYVEGGLFKRYLAVMLEDGGALPVASLTLNRAEYDAILKHRE